MISPFAIPAPGSIGAGSDEIKASSSSTLASAEGVDLVGASLVGPVLPPSIATSVGAGSDLTLSSSDAILASDSGEGVGAATINAQLPSGIASEESVSEPAVILPVYPVSLSSAEAIGDLRLGPALLPSSIKAPGSILASSDSIKASAEDILASDYARDLFGEPELVPVIATVGISSEEALGYPDINPALPVGIPTEEAFGTAGLLATITPNGINTGENIAPPQIDLAMSAVGISTEEVFGLQLAVQYVTPAGIPSHEAFGAIYINTLAPAGIVSAEAIGTPQLDLGIAAVGGETEFAVGTAQLNLSVQTVSISPPGSILAGSDLVKASSDTVLASSYGHVFGYALIELGLVAVGAVPSETFGVSELFLIGGPVGVASGEAFGTARLDISITPIGAGSQEAFGTQYFYHVQMVGAVGIASDEAFGTTSFPFYIQPPSIGTAEEVPLPVVSNAVIWPGLVEAGGQLGVPVLDFSLGISGIEPGEAIGLAQFSISIVVTGIASEEALGQAALGKQVFPTSIQSLESVSLPNIVYALTVAGIATAEAVGQAQVNSPIFPVGVVPGEAFGNAAASHKVLPSGIASLEGVPAPFIFDHVVYAPSIPTQESFGTALVGEPPEVLVIEPRLLISREKFGTPTLHDQISTFGIQSEETFGYIPSITESHILFVPDIIFTEEAFGEPLVLPNYTLTLENLDSTPTATTPALGQHNILSLSDIDEYPTQSAFTLTQHYQLSVESVDEIPITDYVFLSQDHQLVTSSLTSTPFMAHVYFGGFSYFSDPGVESGSDEKSYRDTLADQVSSSPEYGFRSGMLISTKVYVVVDIVLASNDEIITSSENTLSSGAVMAPTSRTFINGRGYESSEIDYEGKLPDDVIRLNSKGLSSGALSVYPDRETVITERGLAGSGTKGWRAKRTG